MKLPLVRRLGVVYLLALTGLVLPRPATPQSTLDRSPNLSGGWAGQDGTIYFHFLHRFRVGDEPLRKVFNSPTFLLGAGLPGRTLVGLHYATNSDVVPAFPNEWELFGRWAPLAESAGAPLDVGVMAGYNQAAESVDGELSLGRTFGPLRVLGAFRALGNAYYADSTRFAWAGGATLRLSRSIALAGDVASLTDREPGEDVAWSVGLQLAIPLTPHTFSLQASNATTTTLQGASRGRDNVWYGFEFTIPVTLSRYFGRRPAAQPQPLAPATGPVVRVDIRDFEYSPARVEVAAGTTVEFTNRGQLVHTATADDGTWDSGAIEPGWVWRYTFGSPGTFPYHCTPHPFMQGTVVVR